MLALFLVCLFSPRCSNVKESSPFLRHAAQEQSWRQDGHTLVEIVLMIGGSGYGGYGGYGGEMIW